MGRMTIEMPLSARVIIVLLFWSLVWIVFIVPDSRCVLCLGFGLLFRCKLFMCSATSFL